jgi:hypothetical protein
MRWWHSQDKNWSQHVIYLYWTPPQPRDFGDEGSRTRRQNNYYAEDEADQLGVNKGVWSVIANQSVAQSEMKFTWIDNMFRG